jgi:hypothetical protein
VAQNVCVDLAIRANFVENVSLLLCILTFIDILLQNNL